MKLRKVVDLKKYLEKNGLSPEAFAQDCLVSNMTIRRLLTRDLQNPIPQKYWAAFDQATQASQVQMEWNDFGIEDFSEFAKTLEEDGQGEHDFGKMEDDIKTKNKSPQIGQKLKNLVTTVFKAAISDQVSKKDKFLAVGAILYFLNPIDLIPDTIVGVGYLDDYAVLTLVAARLAHYTKSGDEQKKEVKAT